MMSKERLLAGLNELIFVEEGFVTMYANFSRAVINETEGIDEDKKKQMNRLLTRLYNDSSRHREMVEALIEKVEEGEKSEY